MATVNLCNGPALLSIGAQYSGGSLSELGYAMGGVFLELVEMTRPHMHDGFGDVEADTIVTGIAANITLKLAHLDYDVYESLRNRGGANTMTSPIPGYLLGKNSKFFRLGITSPHMNEPYLFYTCRMISPRENLNNDGFAPEFMIRAIPYGTSTTAGKDISSNSLYTRTIA